MCRFISADQQRRRHLTLPHLTRLTINIRRVARLHLTPPVKEALISIQQASLELTKDDRLLEFIHDNHRWREEIGEWLSRTGTWSLATKTSVAWVVIAFLLTLADSFVSPDRRAENAADGHAVGTVWLWLLCLVFGWTWVPIFDSGEIRTALNYANQRAASNATKKLERAGRVTRIFLERARERLTKKPAREVGNRENPEDAGQEPNQHANPSVEPNGGEGGDPVDPVTVEPLTLQEKLDPKVHQLLELKNLGLLNRDERRPPATGDTDAPFVGEKVVFPQGVFFSMIGAAIMALILQCGTAVAAAIIIIFTPPLGLECRSLGYVIYGGVSIVIMFLSIISTIFARISETREESSTVGRCFTKSIAIAFCWISYLLALINGVGLIGLSCFQFAHFLDECYCNASVLGRGVDSYIVVSYDDSKTTMRVSRLAATLLSAVVMWIYMFT